MTSTTASGELDRTIGFTGALTIGTGTMIGAGIFVFPGLAGGRAGPAATLSFLIGALIALLVALPASELATAMPKSGGGYYFISRGLGTLPGAIVGIGLTFGLIFASAFYLVGFGQYVAGILLEAGIVDRVTVTVGPVPLGIGVGVVGGVGLTAMSVLGTENAETLQNLVVGLLLAILVGVLSISLIDLLGVGGQADLGQFAPRGYQTVLPTAALVFTSYLGFAQIATIGEDIVAPDRTLPRAMIGSVFIVGILYVVTLFVTGHTFAPETLRRFGETATVEVARAHLGLPGAIIILFAGLLATISSANASILSASRAMYAISADQLAPEAAATVNRRYGTPHFALSFAGGLTVLLVASGRTAVLAEVASFLHLVMYGLLCVTLLVLRRRNPPWYDPAFRCPGYPAVPVVGALASFALLAFMQPLSQLLGVFLSIGAVAWYGFYARGTNLRGKR